jgi:hypothetical protein
MKSWLLIGSIGLALATGACTSMFMVGKGGTGGYLGCSSPAMYEMLCTSGDMEKVLATTHLSKDMKDAFYKHSCSEERSRGELKQLYASMTSEQRKDLKTAFKKNGYSVNAGKGCAN